jgi:hypothetical protein
MPSLQFTLKSFQKRFGEGPHRVRFHVLQASEKDGTMNKREFDVLLASLDYMPVSVHYFLETVSNGIWDNTVFIHHEDVEHVIAAAPIDYQTQKSKNSDLNNIGLKALPFPEYSEKYEHKQYTIGFASTGPSFYINTVDNSKSHGPDGQSHHLLTGDADPCFGLVADRASQNVVKNMIRYANFQREAVKKSPIMQSNHPWSKDDYTWNPIVKVEIINL